MNDEPHDLDEEDDRPRKRRRQRPRDEHEEDEEDHKFKPLLPPSLLTFAKVGLVVLGGAVAFAAFGADSLIKTSALAGLACYIGIMARVAQAEEHRVFIEMRRSREK